MGRSRTPTAKLEVTGAYVRNPGRRAARAHEPRPDGPLGRPPGHLRDDEQAIWREVAALVPWAAASDRVALELVAGLLGRLRRDGELPGSHLTALIGLLSKLGMSPSDRSKVSAPPPEEPEDPAELFFS